MNTATDHLWEVFQSRVCDLKTSEFLRSEELTGLISSLTNAHAAREAATLRRFFASNHESVVAELLERRPRIAVTNCFLVNYSGSELWTEDVAGYLARLGLSVIVHSPHLGAVAERMRSGGINVTDDAASVADFEPDILHINHYAAAAPVLSAVRNGPAIVNMIHGLLPRPGLPGVQGVNAYCAVGLHAQAKAHLLTETAWDSIRLVPSFFDAKRFNTRPSVSRQKRALIFSSKTAVEHRERLAAILASVGYEVDHVGYGGVPHAEPEDLLPNYELVFAVARSATEALACGCRVVLWDSGLIGPLVRGGADYWSFVAANFSMAACTLPWRSIDDPEAADWLRDQVAEVHDADASDMTQKNLSLDKVGPMLLSVYRDVLGVQGNGV